MARKFKMHRARPARHQAGRGIAPLGSRDDKAGSRARPIARHGAKPADTAATPVPAKERGGPQGPEPTRYGDWEKNGICYDF